MFKPVVIEWGPTKICQRAIEPFRTELPVARMQADDTGHLPATILMAPDNNELVGPGLGIMFGMIDKPVQADLDGPVAGNPVDF